MKKKNDLPLVDHVMQYVIKQDDEDQLDQNRMLKVDPMLQLERKRHQVLLEK